MGKKITKQRWYDLWSRYGLHGHEYEDLLEYEDHKCAICGEPFTEDTVVCVDHCHTTNKIRGLLCASCNKGLGMFKDSVSFLFKAIKYLLTRSNKDVRKQIR